MLDVHAPFQHMHALSRSQPAPDLTVRRQALRRLEVALLAHQQGLQYAISQDFGGRSPHETQLLELFPTLDGIRHTMKHLKRWMQPERRSTGLWHLPGSNHVYKQPLGLVGIIVPWNYPLFLSVGPLTAALAAGNRVMLKLSEFTPAFNACLRTVLADCFPEDQVRLVEGDAGLAAAFAALPFDHLLFTGSTAVGRKVMAAAAANLTPVTLELGGKSPVIAGDDLDVESVARQLMFGKCANAGQTCVAPDYLLLPRKWLASFPQAAEQAVRSLYPVLASNTDYSHIINAAHRQRLQGYLDDALAKGARAVPLHDEDGLTPGQLVPTVLLGVTDEMRVMQEEIFGPILPVIPYDDLGEAIAFVNARPRPLALYFLGNRAADRQRILAETCSGGVTFNDTMLHVGQHDLPFGGVGPSGMGHYHGHEGFLTFSKLKPVYTQRRWNGLVLMKPPYGPRFARIMRWMLRA